MRLDVERSWVERPREAGTLYFVPSGTIPAQINGLSPAFTSWLWENVSRPSSPIRNTARFAPRIVIPACGPQEFRPAQNAPDDAIAWRG